MSESIDPKAETVRVATLVVKALTDVGQAYRRDDGTWQTIRFRTTGYGEITGGGLVAVLEVDTQRLPKRVTARDLVKPEMLHHLSTVCGHPVRCLNSVGVTYVVGLTPPPAAPRLPSRVPLDLDHQPAGDLPVPIGVGRDGAVWIELRALGHTLVTGTSGSGKSSWIHAALAGLLSSTDRTRLQVALIDPKRSEFAAWAGVPQLYGQIATDDTSSAKLLDMLVGEMERRGDLLAGALARDLASYNKRAAAPLPYMLVVIDEVLDLLLGGNKAIETSLVRLAAKGRSAGILVWIATQHARYDLLPRPVALNLSTRLVFRVQDAKAAELAGCPGAQSIPRIRPGRMLARLDGEPQVMQGYYVDDAMLQTMVAALGAVPPKAKPELDELEIRMVRYAVATLDGRFVINALAAQFGSEATHHRIQTLGKRLERRGLLAPPEGPNFGRRVTPELEAMAR
jgi:energy-coupling factor transporter ATP-binding protein EcfA2